MRIECKRAAALLLAICSLLSLAACASDGLPAPAPTGTEEETAATVTVHLILPNGEETELVRPGEAFELPTPAKLRNYTFLGWRSEEDRLLPPGPVTVEEEVYFSAEYGIALETASHPAYLFPDSEGNIRPQDALKRGEAMMMFHSLLSLQPRGHVYYSDVAWASPWRDAAASLKTLGLYPGSTLQPEKSVTLGELLELLSHFYPVASGDYLFADVRRSDPSYGLCCMAAELGWIESGPAVHVGLNKRLTRLRTAELMNRVLGRSADPRALNGVYDAFPDLPQSERSKLTMLEASVEHNFLWEDGAEVWLESALPPDPIPGFSTGDAQLDELLKAVLDQTVDEDMELVEKLSALYNYVYRHIKYRKGPIYEIGDTSFVVEQARQTLADKRGNCYGFASVLYELYHAVGFDAQIYSGQVSHSPHAWVEGEIDGVRYVFDPELQLRNTVSKDVDLFMKTYEETKRWSYYRGEQDEEGAMSS